MMSYFLLYILIQKAAEFAQSPEGKAYNPPDGPLYYFILVGSSLIVLITLYLTVKWFLWPGEQSKNHIKHKILKEHF